MNLQQKVPLRAFAYTGQTEFPDWLGSVELLATTPPQLRIKHPKVGTHYLRLGRTLIYDETGPLFDAVSSNVLGAFSIVDDARAEEEARNQGVLFEEYVTLVAQKRCELSAHFTDGAETWDSLGILARDERRRQARMHILHAMAMDELLCVAPKVGGD